jgi:hypothetical protein
MNILIDALLVVVATWAILTIVVGVINGEF